ncbi:hypothetical protein TGAMA5MH_00886 [Trichoderma gamsii]|uniref:Uncharacterized protein n=1 Tax=Trichoderma gamsii TaxID=398673 RepID=A0A2K0TQN0_9HYPO|nr:hypothetical protein TGAMA5MH_00886 [Trichoderma gamsii]
MQPLQDPKGGSHVPILTGDSKASAGAEGDTLDCFLHLGL